MVRSRRAIATFEDHSITLQDISGADSVRLSFDGASSGARPAGRGAPGVRYNFYTGSDASRWRTGVPGYRSIVYDDLYPGIDLQVRDGDGRLEYDLLLGPGADLDGVAIACEGVSALEVADDGALVMHTAAGLLRQTPPRTWEVLPSGERRPLHSGFRLLGAQRYGFEAPGRDSRLALIVDPRHRMVHLPRRLERRLDRPRGAGARRNWRHPRRWHDTVHRGSADAQLSQARSMTAGESRWVAGGQRWMPWGGSGEAQRMFLCIHLR